MTDRLRSLTDAELGLALQEVGRHLEYPEVQVAARVARHLRGATAPRRSRRLRPLTVGIALLLVLGAGTAVAAGLGVPGIGIRFPASPSPAPSSPAGLATDQRFLGRPVDLDQARAQVAFDIALPAGLGLPEPAVHLADDPSGGRVSLVYPGLLITQLADPGRAELLVKEPTARGAVEPVSVNGAAGWWIEGPHPVVFPSADGGRDTETVRSAASALIWSRDGVTFRLEADVSRPRALEIADSLN